MKINETINRIIFNVNLYFLVPFLFRDFREDDVVAEVSVQNCAAGYGRESPSWSWKKIGK